MKKLALICLVAAAWSSCSKVEETIPSTVQSDNNLSNATVKHKRINLTQGGDKGLYLNGNNFAYSPGDTLVLSGNWSYCTLENFRGSENNYVVLINSAGGQVNLTSGFSLTNCHYVKVVGRGSKTWYGFKISSPTNDGVGVTITGRSSNIIISRIDIYNKTYGYWVKQEASCIDSLQYPNFIMRNITIHDGRIRKANQEGLYLGSTDPNGLRPINCNGATIYPKPLRLENIKVYNMVIDSTNRSGIQLSCAQTGKNEIYNNTITNCGYEFNSNGQGSGISLGGYTTAFVHDNNIQNTYTMGISSLGAGTVDIENNIVKSSGTLAGKSVNGMASIMIDTRYTSPADSTTFIIKNNTLGSTTDFNVRVYNTYPTYSKKGNTISANGAATISVAGGVNWGK